MNGAHPPAHPNEVSSHSDSAQLASHRSAMADGAILLAILLVLQSYAAHISKNSRRQITDTLAVARGYQTKPNKAKAAGRQQQLEKRGGLGRPAEAHHLPTGHLPIGRQSVPYYSLGDHSTVPAPRRRDRASPSRPSGDRN